MKATHHPNVDTDDDATPADVLRGAAAYLRRHGWIKGTIFDLLSPEPFPPACAIGAINMATYGRCIISADDHTDDPEADQVIRALRVFASTLDPDYDPFETSAVDLIGDWNDQPGRTRTDVVEALTAAADDWDTAHTGGAR
jgi:hypothetical protein